MSKDRPAHEEEINELYPDAMEEYICPVCEKKYHDEEPRSEWSKKGRPGWRRLHGHMRSHSQKEREKAYAEWDAENLAEATVAIWRQEK